MVSISNLHSYIHTNERLIFHVNFSVFARLNTGWKIFEWIRWLWRNIYQIQGNWADRNFVTSLRVNSLLITHAEIQFMFSLVHTAREKLLIGGKFVRWGVPFTWNHLSSTKIKGVLTWQRGDLRDGATSLPFPLVALHLFTWYHHKMSCRRESPRREFTQVVVPGREFHSGTKSRKGIL